MFAVMIFDEATLDTVAIFEGTLEACRDYIATEDWEDEYEMPYIYDYEECEVVD